MLLKASSIINSIKHVSRMRLLLTKSCFQLFFYHSIIQWLMCMFYGENLWVCQKPQTDHQSSVCTPSAIKHPAYTSQLKHTLAVCWSFSSFQFWDWIMQVCFVTTGILNRQDCFCRTFWTYRFNRGTIKVNILTHCWPCYLSVIPARPCLCTYGCVRYVCVWLCKAL